MNPILHMTLVRICVHTPDEVLKVTTTVLLTMVACNCFRHSAVRVATYSVSGSKEVIQWTVAFVSTDSLPTLGPLWSWWDGAQVRLNVMSQPSKQVTEWSHTILTLVSLTSIAFVRVGGRSSSVCTRTKRSQFSFNMFHCMYVSTDPWHLPAIKGNWFTTMQLTNGAYL